MQYFVLPKFPNSSKLDKNLILTRFLSIGIGTVLLIVICQFLYCSLFMLAAGEMC